MSVLYMRQSARRWFRNFCLEVWFRYNLKNARFELEKFDEARKQDIAGAWRGVVRNLEDELKAMGIDPKHEPEDLTKMLEVWLLGGVLFLVFALVVLFNLSRAELFQLLK